MGNTEIVSIEPNWIPLEKFFNYDHSKVCNFMFMGTTQAGVHLYKNRNNRRYLNISDDGRAHKYAGDQGYVEISKEDALKAVEEES